VQNILLADYMYLAGCYVAIGRYIGRVAITVTMQRPSGASPS